MSQRIRAEADEQDLVEVGQFSGDGLRGDRGRFGDGIAVNAGRDGREGDRPQGVRAGEGQAVR